jgi:hypothetical protein
VFHLAGAAGLRLAEDVRMAEDELVAKGVADVGNVKFLLLFANLGIEDDVEQDVAKLLLEVFVVARDDGGTEFVGFFDGVGAERFVGLLAVPRTLLAQLVEDVEQSPERLHFLLSSMFLHKSDVFMCFCGQRYALPRLDGSLSLGN